MIVAVASGKGGTGETSVAVNLALSIESAQLLDCDVEEPNAHLLLKPKITNTEQVYRLVPSVKERVCTYCGKCAENRLGELKVGEAMAVPLIREVKKRMDMSRNIVLDAPPGASCPFIETVKGSDFCLLVTEPTPFGLHDFANCSLGSGRDWHPSQGCGQPCWPWKQKSLRVLQAKNIPILLEIPYRREIAELYAAGIPFSLKLLGWREKFKGLFRKIEEIVK